MILPQVTHEKMGILGASQQIQEVEKGDAAATSSGKAQHGILEAHKTLVEHIHTHV